MIVFASKMRSKISSQDLYTKSVPNMKKMVSETLKNYRFYIKNIIFNKIFIDFYEKSFKILEKNYNFTIL